MQYFIIKAEGDFINFLVFFLILILTFSNISFSTTYYIRTDGGDSTQFNGKENAPYPGEGENQNCAWSYPYLALNELGEWKIISGDILIIGSGSYMIGYGAPNTSSWCDADGAYACILPPIPSGTSYIPTKILGSGYSSSCSNPP